MVTPIGNNKAKVSYFFHSAKHSPIFLVGIKKCGYFCGAKHSKKAFLFFIYGQVTDRAFGQAIWTAYSG